MNAAVLRGPGTNCDQEAVLALTLAGFRTELVHVKRFLEKEKRFSDYSFVMLPGGFLHGDYLGSGKIMASLLRFNLAEEFKSFVDGGGLVLGVCNGFQVLAKAGVLPGFNGNYSAPLSTLTFNASGRFECRWVTLKKVHSKSPLLEGINELNVPIAHGEGRFVPKDTSVLRRLYHNRQIAFKYTENPNGSVDDIAGITDESGRVLGLMPHPERNLYSILSPAFAANPNPGKGEGLKLFENAFAHLKR
ncbi:MAG: phosphoribosylformylglycinamidine synthase I [Candidatus Diapherotrites archaeon]|nr:phosphoribosylformylglycinamidine synthase I [Candidatus Diapherotrites archaeon]